MMKRKQKVEPSKGRLLFPRWQTGEKRAQQLLLPPPVPPRHAFKCLSKATVLGIAGKLIAAFIICIRLPPSPQSLLLRPPEHLSSLPHPLPGLVEGSFVGETAQLPLHAVHQQPVTQALLQEGTVTSQGRCPEVSNSK